MGSHVHGGGYVFTCLYQLAHDLVGSLLRQRQFPMYSIFNLYLSLNWDTCLKGGERAYCLWFAKVLLCQAPVLWNKVYWCKWWLKCYRMINLLPTPVQPISQLKTTSTFNLIDFHTNETLPVLLPLLSFNPTALPQALGGQRDRKLTQTQRQTAQRKDVTSTGTDNQKCYRCFLP